jgi:hypothetical protein
MYVPVPFLALVARIHLPIWKAKTGGHRCDRKPGKLIGTLVKIQFLNSVKHKPVWTTEGAVFFISQPVWPDQFSAKKRKVKNSFKNVRKENWEVVI